MIDLEGRGIVAPFQRDGKGDFVNMEGEDLLRADLAELLGITGPGKHERGELPWRDELGSRLINLKHRQLFREDVLAVARSKVAEVVRRWEGRVRVGRFRAEVRGQNQLRIFFTYVPIGYNSTEAQEAEVTLDL